MGTYDAQTATARRLIAAKGARTVIDRHHTTKRDPITQTGGTSSIETATVDVVAFPSGKGAEFAVGSLAKRSVFDLYIAHDRAFTPQPGDTLTWGGSPLTIIWSATYDPAADGAIFTKAYGERGGG